MSHQLHNSLVRILTADGIPVGVGFLAADNLILTCAHVIVQASGLEDSVHFDLPLLAPGKSFSGRVSFRDEEQDIACIEVTDLPQDAEPVRLVQTAELWGHTFRAFGVPQGYDSGVWASGVLRDQNAQGWLHIEDVKTTGVSIKPGFSGGPVWDDNLGEVIGMVVAADRDESTKVAFCSPVGKLSEAVPALKAQSIPPNPYRGLYAFREQDAPLFFGRETFSETLLEAVSSRSLVAVVGASGAGKSSVVFAGLLPRLRPNAEWLIAEFRPGPRPFESLAAALLLLLEPAMSEIGRLLEMSKLAGALRSGELVLGEIIQTIIRKHADAQHLLLFADQFEELYTLCDEVEMRRAFVDTLLAGMNEGGLTLLLTLRADFMGQSLSHRPFADALQNADLKLGPMTPDELMRAISQPAEKGGVRFEEGLPELIVGDVVARPGALPLLEFALSQLWERQQNGKLTLNAYQSIGSVEGALALYADQVYVSLNEVEQEQARRIFIQLVAPGAGTEDTRRLTARTELKEDDWHLVRRIADLRLVVTDQTPEEKETVEIVHEALIREWGKLRNWMEKDRAFRAWQERLRVALGQWQESEENHEALLQGLALPEAADWLENRGEELNNIELSFVQKSLSFQAEKEKTSYRLRQFIMLGLISGFLIVAVFAVFAVLQWGRAEEQANVALARQLAAKSLNLIKTEPEVALLLSYEAFRSLPHEHEALSELEQTLTKVLLDSTFRGDVFTLDNYIYRADISPKKDKILLQPMNASYELWSLDGSKISTFSDNIEIAKFSPDGSSIIGIGYQIYILDNYGNLIDTIVVEQFGLGLASGDFVFSSDSKNIVISQYFGTITIVHLPTNASVSWDSGYSELWSVKISPNNRQILTFGCEKNEGFFTDTCVENSVKLWDIQGNLVQTITDVGVLKFADFGPSGKIITSACIAPIDAENSFLTCDTTVKLWDSLGDYIELENSGRVDSVYLNPDRTLFITASDLDSGFGQNNMDKPKLWTEDGQLLMVLEKHDGGGSISALSFSPSGEKLLIADAGGKLEIWGIDGDLLYEFQAHPGLLKHAYWTDQDGIDERVITIGCDVFGICTNFEIKAWDINGATREPIIEGDGNLYSLDFSGDGESLLVWEVSEQDTHLILWKESRPLKKITNLPDEYSFGGTFFGNNILIWDLHKPDESEVAQDSNSGYFLDFDFMAKHSSLRLINLEGEEIRKIDTAMPLFMPPFFDKSFRGFAEYRFELGSSLSAENIKAVLDVDRNGQYFLELNQSNHLILTDGSSGEVVHDYGDTNSYHLMSMGADGTKVLITSCEERDNDNNCLRFKNTVVFSDGTSFELKESKDKTFFTYAGDQNRYLVVYCVENKEKNIGEDITGECTSYDARTYNQQGTEISSLSIIKSFDQIFVSLDAKVVLFVARSTLQTRSGQILLWDSIQEKTIQLEGITGQIESVSMSDSGERIVTLSSDNIVRVWNDKGHVIYSIENSGEKFLSAIINGSGTLIATSNQSGAVELWEMYPSYKSMVTEACNRLSRNLTISEWQQYVGTEKPYNITCPEAQLPEDVKMYLDGIDARNQKIREGVIGLLALIGLLIICYRRVLRKG